MPYFVAECAVARAVYFRFSNDQPIIKRRVIAKCLAGLIVGSSRLLHHKNVDCILMLAVLHQDGVGLVEIDVGIVDGFVEQTVGRVGIEVKPYFRRGIRFVQIAQLVEHEPLSVFAAAVRIAHQVKVNGDILYGAALFDTVAALRPCDIFLQAGGVLCLVGDGHAANAPDFLSLSEETRCEAKSQDS